MVKEAISAANARIATEPFKPAKKYSGSIPGMVFRTGTDGTCYYPDVATIATTRLHESLFPLAGIAPVNLSIQELVPRTAMQQRNWRRIQDEIEGQMQANMQIAAEREHPIQVDAGNDPSPQPLSTDSDDITTAKRQAPEVGPRMHRTESRGMRRTPTERDIEMGEDPRDQEWPQSDAVAVRSRPHHSQGDWAVDTVNPTAGSTRSIS